MQVQRLQRFATYGYLKQVVLKMIAADLAVGSGADLLSEDQCEAISMVTALRLGRPTFMDVITSTNTFCASYDEQLCDVRSELSGWAGLASWLTLLLVA